MVYLHKEEFHTGDLLHLSLQNRALNYGDGLFESMKFAHGRINFWEDHYFRLMSSMRILRMEIPLHFSPEFLEGEIRRVIEKNGYSKSAVRVKLLVFRDGGGRYTPESRNIDYIITVEPLLESDYNLAEEGLIADIYQDHYIQKSLLSNLKLTSAPLYVLASIYREENNLGECFMLNDAKSLCESISSNMFLVKGTKVLTPAASTGCLKGVMRKQLIKLLPSLGYEVEESDNISPFELQKVDEVILSNSVKGIQWVKQFRKRSYGSDLSERLVEKLNVAVALS